MGSNEAPKLILYTNYGCPWAHRAQIVLKELNLDFETKIIDLSVPRTPEYLAINPVGQVPTLSYNGEIITESLVISQFLSDAHPSHLQKPSNSFDGALQRARVNSFEAAYFGAVNSIWFSLVNGAAEEQEAKAVSFVDAIVKRIEPLLQNTKPFFDGSDRLTLVEVLTGSFLLRVLSFPQHGIVPKSVTTDLETRAPAFWKWANAVVKENSVTYIWDVDTVVEKQKARIAKNRAALAAAGK